MDFQSAISFLDSHNGAITAMATIVLAVITIWYATSTYRLLKETQVARKIKAIEKQLERFYYPLKDEIFRCKSETYKEDTKYRISHAEFMRCLYLCKNNHVSFVLKMFIDPQSNVGFHDLINIQEFVDKDIKILEEEWNRLLLSKKGLLTQVREKFQDIFKRNKWEV